MSNLTMDLLDYQFAETDDLNSNGTKIDLIDS